MSSSNSAFNWRNDPRPSIFATDRAFTYGAESGKTLGSIQTEAVERFAKRTGRSAGSIPGMSAKGDAHIEESNHARRARRA